MHDPTTLEVPVAAGAGAHQSLRPPTGRSSGRHRRHLLAGGAVIVAVLAAGLVWQLLRPDRPPGAWGGHENGRIPAVELCALPGAPSHRLRCDAAAAYGRMATAYRSALGTRMCVTDSYRPLEAQERAADRKPELAAKPGTSNHGWALAVDLCGGANDFGTRQHRWLQANAARFGWRQPTWAAKGGTRPEPWHWEFGKIS